MSVTYVVFVIVCLGFTGISVDGKSNFTCKLNDDVTTPISSNPIVSLSTECTSREIKCVDDKTIWYSVFKTVHLLSKNASTFYNNNITSIIILCASRNRIHLISFYEDKIVIHFRSSSHAASLQIVSERSTLQASSVLTSVEAIVKILVRAGWTRMLLLSDNQSVSEATSMASALSSYNIFLTFFTIDVYTNVKLHNIIRTSSNEAGGTLNVSMICHALLCMKVFKSVQYVNETLYIQDQMRIQHLSKWIVFNQSAFNADSLNSINLDNVLFIQQIFKTANNCKEQSNHDTADEGFSLQTLLWSRDGRQLSSVGAINSTEDPCFDSMIYPNVRYGLNGRMLRVTTIEWGICTAVENDGNFTGLCFDILKEIAFHLNFTYEVYVPDDDAFGAILPNGSWTGMVGMIQSNKADLVASTLTINPEREQIVDFTYPIIFDYVTIVFAKPGVNKWRTLLNPYTDIVYALIGVSLLFVSSLFFLLERWHPKYDDVSNRPPPNFYHSFWYMYGALLAQGGETLPTSTAGRTIISSWWIFCIISIAVYSGNLTATLAVDKHKMPFTTIEEMIKQKVYKWGTLGNSVYPTFFKNSAVSSYKEVWNGIIEFNKSDPSVLSASASEHFRKVSEGNYAFIMGRAAIDYETANNCNIIILEESISPNSLAFALSNDSPFVELVSHAILTLHENGFISKWKSVRWPRRTCDEPYSFTTKIISIEDIQSAFYLIAIGVTLSSVLLIVERIMKFYRNREKRN